MLDPNATITFVNGDFYNKDLNNFGPTRRLRVGRDQGRQDGGARRLLAHVRQRGDRHRRATNAPARQRRPQHGRDAERTSTRPCGAGVPAIATPTFLTTAHAGRPAGAERDAARCGAIDPGHRRSRTCTRSASASSASCRGRSRAEARYVGTFGRGIWRGIDYNQIKTPRTFLADFQRAREQRVPGAGRAGALLPDLQRQRRGQPAADGAADLRAADQLDGAQPHPDRTRWRASRTSTSPAGSAGRWRTFMHNPGIYAAQAHLATAGSATTTGCSSTCAASSGTASSRRRTTRSRTRRPTRPARRRAGSRRSSTTTGPS